MCVCVWGGDTWGLHVTCFARRNAAFACVSTFGGFLTNSDAGAVSLQVRAHEDADGAGTIGDLAPTNAVY